jgi:hypothetical protein
VSVSLCGCRPGLCILATRACLPHVRALQLHPDVICGRGLLCRSAGLSLDAVSSASLSAVLSAVAAYSAVLSACSCPSLQLECKALLPRRIGRARCSTPSVDPCCWVLPTEPAEYGSHDLLQEDVDQLEQAGSDLVDQRRERCVQQGRALLVSFRCCLYGCFDFRRLKTQQNTCA